MKKITFKNLDHYKTKKSKHKYRWQEVAEDISNFYNKSLYWLFYRYPLGLIEMAYRRQKQKNDTNLNHLLFILSNKQNNPKWIATKFIEIRARDKNKAETFLELKKHKLKTATYNYLKQRL